MLKGIGGIIAAVVAVIVVGLLILVWAGLAIGAGNAWILQGTFSDGWHAVWDRWGAALGWSVLFGSVFTLSRAV